MLKKIKKYSLILLLFSILSFWGIVYAFDLFSASGEDDDYNIANNAKDTYNIVDLNISESRLYTTDRDSSNFTNWERFKIIQQIIWSDSELLRTGSGFIVSEQYWDLYISGAILASVDNSFLSNCDAWEQISYSLNWELFSYFWWNFVIDGWESFYCPWSKKMKLILKWTTTEELALSWWWNLNLVEDNESNIVDVRWNERNISTSELFSSNKISITGIVSFDIKNWAVNEVWFLNSDSINNNKFVIIDYNVSSRMSKFKETINKNIIKLTKWIEAKKYWDLSNRKLFNLENNNVYYYDFEWSEWDLINYNKWGILELKNWNGVWIWDNIEINWEKTLIIKWWNIYINSNIYNKDKKSLLTIIVKRDSKNRKNWWNIYIDPDVTNIDAILISEGSILSFYNNNIYNSKDNADFLRKQLLIYGSIITRNSIWKDIAIYWTDDYIHNHWASMPSKKYNLENLRSFRIMPSENVESWYCSWEEWRIVAKQTNTESLKYAFAWGKLCYYTDSGDWKLRTTEKVSSLVIEKNPNISVISSKILQE